jgi:site-specific recombinase XerD
MTNMTADTPLPDAWENALAAFENDLYRRDRSEKTVASYRSCLQSFALFYRNELQKPGPYIARLQENDLKAFIDHIRYDRRLSAATVNRYIAALRAFSSFILLKRWHRRQLTRDLKRYRIYTSRIPASLSRREVRRMISAVDEKSRNGLRNMALLQLMLQCGLRVGEIVCLSRDDVTLHKTVGRLRVRAAKPEHERTIPLNATARRALQDHLDALIPGSGSDPLFISERGRRMGVGAVQYLVKKYLCFAGREDLSANDLRNHFAMEFYKRSGKLTATQKVLGHRNINTTTRYARATDLDIQEPIDALDP